MPTKTVDTFTAREPLETVRADLAVQIPLTMAAGFACQKGDVIGQIASSGFGRRRARSLVTAMAFATTSPTGTVAEGTLFKTGDVLNSAGGAVGTIQSIAGNTITLAANAGVAVATGAAVLASDGSQVAKAIVDEGSDGVGETPVRVFIGGYLKESKLRGLDQAAKTELGGVSLPSDIFKF